MGAYYSCQFDSRGCCTNSTAVDMQDRQRRPSDQVSFPRGFKYSFDLKEEESTNPNLFTRVNQYGEIDFTASPGELANKELITS